MTRFRILCLITAGILFGISGLAALFDGDETGGILRFILASLFGIHADMLGAEND